MTACSSHPGTVAGAALKALLEESDRLADLYRRQVEAVARQHELSYADYSALTQVAGQQVAPAADQLQRLYERGLISNALPPELLPQGAAVMAEANAALCNWFDAQSVDDDVRCRQIAEQLRALRKVIE